jgi:hypothetical protein
VWVRRIELWLWIRCTCSHHLPLLQGVLIQLASGRAATGKRRSPIYTAYLYCPLPEPRTSSPATVRSTNGASLATGGGGQAGGDDEDHDHGY